MTYLLSRPTRGGPGQILKILPAASHKVYFRQKYAYARIGRFPKILSSRNLFPSVMDMRRKDLRVPGPGDIAQSPL